MSEPNLLIRVDFDTSPTQKKATILEGAMSKVGAVIDTAFGKANKSQEQYNMKIEKTQAKIAELKRQMAAMKDTAAIDEMIRKEDQLTRNLETQIKTLQTRKAELQESLDNAVGQYSRKAIQKELNAVEKELTQTIAKVDKSNFRAADLEGQRNSILNDTENSTKYQQLADSVRLAEMELANLQRTADETGRSEVVTLGERLSNGLRSAGKVAKNVFNTLKKAADGFFKFFNKNSKKSGNMVTKFYNRVKGLVLRAFIFNAISKNLRSLVSGIKSYIATNDAFTTSLQIAKGNLLSAFQPIWEAIMPALTALGSALQYVTGLLLQFMSLLSGKSVSVLMKNAKAMREQAKATSAAGSAAQGALAPFDELNVLQQNQGGGGGAEADDTMFELPEFEVPEWLKNLALEIKAGNWGEAGKLLAQKLNDMIGDIDWAHIGTKIGQGLNNAFTFALGFLRELDTESIGIGVATMINNIFDNLSADTFGRSIGAFWNRVIDFMYGVVTTLEWSKIGTWIGTAINGFFLEFDWAKLGVTISEFVKGILTLLISAISTTDWSLIGSSIREAIINIDWEGIVSDIFVLVEGLMKAALDLLGGLLGVDMTWLKESVIEPLFNALKTGFEDVIKLMKNPQFQEFIELIALIATGVGGAILAVTGFKTVLSLLSGFMAIMASPAGVIALIVLAIAGIVTITGNAKEMIDNLKLVMEGFADFFMGVFTNDWSRAWQGLEKIAKGTINGMITLIESFVNGVVMVTNAIIDMLNSFKFSVDVPGFGEVGFAGLNIPKFDNLKLPRLAQGAVIPGGSEFLAVLGDQPKGQTNIETPLDTMVTAFKTALAETNTNNGQTTVVLAVDGREFGRAVVKTGNAENKRVGTRLVVT